MDARPPADSKTTKTMRTAKGNVSQQTRDLVAGWWHEHTLGNGFGATILNQLEVTDMSVFDNAEIPGKKEGKIVYEVDVTQSECSIIVH